MVTPLDMELDDLVKRRTSSQRGRGQGRGFSRDRGGTFGGRGMGRQGPLSSRPSSYGIAKQSFSRAKGMIWRHDLFNDSMAAVGLPGFETGTKLYISNLDYGVSNQDIKELFSEVGDLKHYTVHYDRNGRPSGSAEVVFVKRIDAMAALKRYNNVQLDGKPMKIEVVGGNLGLPITPRVSVVGAANGRGKRTVVMTADFGQGGNPPNRGRLSNGNFQHRQWRGRGGVHGHNQGSGRGQGGNYGHGQGRGRGQIRGRGRGRGQLRKQYVKKSAKELDKDLESYHAAVMDTS